MKSIVCGLFAAFLIGTLTVQAQSEGDSAAREIVLDAFAGLAEEGYTFSADSGFTQQFVTADETITAASWRSDEGAVTAGGDYDIRVAVRGGETQEALEESGAFRFERRLIGEDAYVRIPEQDMDLVPLFFDITPGGWLREADAIASFDDEIAALTFQNLTQVLPPTDYPVRDGVIEMVTEVESATINDIEMRIFELDMNARAVFLNSTPSSGPISDQIFMLVESAPILNASEFDLMYYALVGAEDGRLYGLEGESRTMLPYLTVGEGSNVPPYDLTMETWFAIFISEHGGSVEIDTPEVMNE